MKMFPYFRKREVSSNLNTHPGWQNLKSTEIVRNHESRPTDYPINLKREAVELRLNLPKREKLDRTRTS
jgi:hypothetical protein